MIVARRLVGVTGIVLAEWLVLCVGLLVGRRPSAEVVGLRLRRTCERLGVTYVKLGQYLATRYDLLPAAVCRELGRLFDRAPAEPFEVVRAQLETELGRPLHEAFPRFEEVPLGSASVAQVHRATTAGGRDVAVKVRRPGVLRIFATDAALVRASTRLLDAVRTDDAFRARDVAEEFLRFTEREFDFRTERRTMQRAAAESSGQVRIPAVVEELSTAGVLTLEFVEGLTYAEAIAIRERSGDEELARRLPGVDLPQVARALAWGLLSQLFVAGHFQADPHPGNIIISRDGTVSLVDFGIFGSLSRERLEVLSQYVENLATGDIPAAVHNYRSVIVYTAATDRPRFRAELTALLSRFHDANGPLGGTAGDRHLGRFSDDLLLLLYRHRVRLELDTLLFWRTLIVLDASSLQVVPDFDLNALLRDFFAAVRPGPAARTVAGLERSARAVARTVVEGPGPRSTARVLGSRRAAVRTLAGRTAGGHRLGTAAAVLCLCLSLLWGRM